MVLASEPVGGRYRATGLPCFYCILTKKVCGILRPDILSLYFWKFLTINSIGYLIKTQHFVYVVKYLQACLKCSAKMEFQVAQNPTVIMLFVQNAINVFKFTCYVCIACHYIK